MRDFFHLMIFYYYYGEIVIEICVTTSTLGSNSRLKWEKGAIEESNMYDDLMTIR
jgi:hypothetical protein